MSEGQGHLLSWPGREKWESHIVINIITSLPLSSDHTGPRAGGSGRGAGAGAGGTQEGRRGAGGTQRSRRDTEVPSSESLISGEQSQNRLQNSKSSLISN